MTAIEELFSLPQYSVDNTTKRELLLSELNKLSKFHFENSSHYHHIISNLRINLSGGFNSIEEIPFLPVRLFKTQKIQSIPDSEVLKVLTSSGTTNQQVSRIALDKETSMLQVKALASIITSYIGHQRLPMIIIDSDATIKNKSSLSARGAGLVGLSNFGRNHFFALDENMELKVDALTEFVEKYKSENILIFGFTFMVWQYFYSKLKSLNEKLNLENAVLIHSGGWKKLIEQSVSNKIFKEALYNQFKIKKVYNFYGMVEQVGSIFMECEKGYLHAPNFAEILIRDYSDWSVLLPKGRIPASRQQGVIQCLSILPKSYPGHSLLTEDLGTVIGIDDCACGRKGTYFLINGRIPKAELRGCSDTHAETVLSSSQQVSA
ncbi:MAG: LuxE/PaaK family acyltransferase [Ignavibacteriaceae bacterium]